jgi:hypothetical protein
LYKGIFSSLTITQDCSDQTAYTFYITLGVIKIQCVLIYEDLPLYGSRVMGLCSWTKLYFSTFCTITALTKSHEIFMQCFTNTHKSATKKVKIAINLQHYNNSENYQRRKVSYSYQSWYNIHFVKFCQSKLQLATDMLKNFIFLWTKSHISAIWKLKLVKILL